jgi:hypothetical protein
MVFPMQRSTNIGTMPETTSGSKSIRKRISLIDLYVYAEEKGIDVDWVSMRKAESLSAELPDGSLCIAMDPWKMESIAKEVVALGHELGHCSTGAFYNRFSKRDIMQKHENRADKWAIKKLVPMEELDAAVAEGHTELWDLAEYFGVTEDFMRKAVCWYTHGNLATELYF